MTPRPTRQHWLQQHESRTDRMIEIHAQDAAEQKSNREMAAILPALRDARPQWQRNLEASRQRIAANVTEIFPHGTWTHKGVTQCPTT